MTDRIQIPVLGKPNHNGLRVKLLTHFRENPGAILTRQEIAESHRVSIKTIDTAIALLKRDGYIVGRIGPGRFVSYALAGTPPLPKPPKAPAPVRKWPEPAWREPQPIPTSVWDLGRML